MNRNAVLRRLADVDPRAGELPGWIYSDPDLFELELERVFDRSWVFLAHASEIPHPGDFVTRDLGNDPVIVARGTDGAIRVLLNVCRHRGMRVCRADAGTSERFQCPYHGWIYGNDGALVAVPFQKVIYGDSFDKSAFPLQEVRSDQYDDLVFATWNTDGPSLTEYLGDIAWYVDVWAHRGPMEVIGPPQRWEVDIDWKIPTENFMSDAYHTSSAHGFSAKVGIVPTLAFAKQGYQIDAGRGHGLTLGMPGPASVFPDEIAAPYRSVLDDDQLSVVHQLMNMPGSVFPNLSFLTSSFAYRDDRCAFTTMRQFHPLGPGRIRISSWLLVERDAPDWWKDRCHRTYLLTFGISGTFEQDDMEIWSTITKTSRSRHGGRTRHLVRMGMDVQPVDFVGPGLVFDGKFCEHNSRAYYARWRDLLGDGSPGHGSGDRLRTTSEPVAAATSPGTQP